MATTSRKSSRSKSTGRKSSSSRKRSGRKSASARSSSRSHRGTRRSTSSKSKSSSSRKSSSRRRSSSSGSSSHKSSGRKYGKKASNKIGKVMHEYKHGQLKSGGRRPVKSRKQAIAIGISEARREGDKVPSRRKSSSHRKAA